MNNQAKVIVSVIIGGCSALVMWSTVSFIAAAFASASLGMDAWPTYLMIGSKLQPLLPMAWAVTTAGWLVTQGDAK